MLTSTLLVAASAIIAAASPTISSPSCTFKPSHENHKKVWQNYLKTWNGDFCNANKTFTPDVVLYQDRLPGANGAEVVPVNSANDFVAFMRRSHTGWDSYRFDMQNWAGDGNNVVVRWTMHGTIGPPDKMKIPTTLKQGDHVSYNGTDWLHLDECTGKIKQVDSAQDFIGFLKDLGVPSIKL